MSKDDAKKESAFMRSFRQSTASTYKWLNIKFGQTRVAANVDALQKYKKIYYTLMENQMPILKGGERKK